MAFLAPLATMFGTGAAVSSVAVPVGTFSAAGGLAGATLAGTATAAGAGLSLSSILGIVGTGLQAIGQIQQGNAQADVTSYNASTARYNAELARQNAVLARQKASEDERRFRVSSAKQLGRMRTGYAKGGVTIEGTPSDILEESAYIAELDALSIRHGGQREAMGYQSEATLYGNEASLMKRQGRTQRKQSYYGAASSLLKGGADLYANWPS